MAKKDLFENHLFLIGPSVNPKLSHTKEFRIMSFIESMEVTCSDSVSHNQVQVLSIPILWLACYQDWTCNLHMIVSLEA